MRNVQEFEELFIIYKGKKIDISPFIDDHPGGREYLLQHAGQDVTAVMSDSSIHCHSASAFSILDSLDAAASGDSTAQKDQEETAAHPRMSAEFVDFGKPVLKQIWSGNYSKEFYLEQIHIARHLSESARMFDSPLLGLHRFTSRIADSHCLVGGSRILVPRCHWPFILLQPAGHS
jgi:4-hydroxysphinganine ceramide fatty acyl 2-hydroxylase